MRNIKKVVVYCLVKFRSLFPENMGWSLEHLGSGVRVGMSGVEMLPRWTGIR